jgi:hypothetical protein
MIRPLAVVVRMVTFSPVVCIVVGGFIAFSPGFL